VSLEATDSAVAVAAPPRPRLRWWREVVYTVVLYGVYSTVRNQFGSAGGPAGQSNGIAYGHALDIIGIEHTLGLYFEPTVQRWYLDLPADGWIGFWNVFYGTAHFIVTAVALIALYRIDKVRYPVWRNTLVFTTLFALIGFASFSLMPPRLLDETFDRFGPPPALDDEADEHGDMVDTLATYPTFWSFDSGTLKNISNQYAAMPSLHIAWSTWVALVLAPMFTRRFWKALVWLHPVATFFCIVVTANHYWLDAVGGLVILGAGYLAGRALADFWDRRAAARYPVTPLPT
jgi:PAP2 superfamily